MNAIVLIGDCVEEVIDPLCHKSGELALRGTPVFAFHEGRGAKAARGFTQIAELSGGACCPFDAGCWVSTSSVATKMQNPSRCW